MQEEWLFNLVSSLKIKEIALHSICAKFGDGGMKYDVLLIEIKLMRIMSILIMEKWIGE